MKIFPQKNIGTPDRVVRGVLGIIIAGYGIFGTHTLLVTILLLLLAGLCIYQALAGWCLWYQIIGKNTCPVTDDQLVQK